MQNTSINNPGQKDDTKVYKIILCFLGLAIIILGAANLIVFFAPKPTSSPISKNETSGSGDVFSYDFNNLTKDQSVAAFKIMNQPGYMPKEYADPALALKDSETIIVLDYSHDSPDEIKDLDFHVSNFGENEIAVTQVGDYYAIVSTDDYKETHSPVFWPKAISFNKKYVDYSKKTEEITFKDTSSAAVRVTLPVYALSNFETQPSSIYSYGLEENENEFVLTLNCIGISIDMEEFSTMSITNSYPSTISDTPFTITNYIVTLSLNKETGEPNWNEIPGRGVSDIINTFRLDEQDKSDLSEILEKMFM